MPFKIKWTDLKIDLLLTLFFCLFWLWFAWQHGFANSPDSWYRGLLGKSIVEGRPFFVNIKVGWLHEYGAWHHDATHGPLLPALYALFFLIFGYKISIANVIVSLSAGLLLFPLLRLSRKFFNTPLAGIILYLLVVFNDKNDFQFEVFSGLSLPTTIMFFAFFLYFLREAMGSENRIYAWGGALALASFYYIRPVEPLVFCWLFLWSMIFGVKHKNVRDMWLAALLLVLPWMIRNLILFGSPFFSHVAPGLWSDRGYDYWSYHETMPYPTPAVYFGTHTILDFVQKIFVRGWEGFLFTLGQSLNSPAWIYLLATFLSLLLIYRKRKDRDTRFFFSIIINALIAYSIIYSASPHIFVRHMIPLYFLMMFSIVFALFCWSGRRAFRLFLLLLVFFLQFNFWTGGLSRLLTLRYSTSDQILQDDPLVLGLKRKISRQEVILGPMAESQRLNFATGLTFIEEPDNLLQLSDPESFFRKYKIRYALVDVNALLSPQMIEKREAVGDKILFTIRQAGEIPLPEKDLLPAADNASILRGIKERRIFIDSFHGSELEDLASIRKMGLKPYISYTDYMSGKNQLFHSGLLLVNWGMKRRELKSEEEEIVKQYIAGGGRILLLCPAWVWVAYERKGLERLSYNQIAKNFALILTADYVAAPLKIVDPRFKVPGAEKELQGVFSGILYEKAKPILLGSDGRAAAVAAERGQARIIIWAQDNLLKKSFLEKPKGRELVRRIFNWLMEARFSPGGS